MSPPFHDPDSEEHLSAPSSPSITSEASCCHADLGDSSSPYNYTEHLHTEAAATPDHSLETPAWTDKKHSDYLNFMEEDFVRRLYGQEYCAVDVCGRPPARALDAYGDDPDTAESRFVGPTEFKVWENGRWIRKLVLKPFVLPAAPSCSSTLMKNPWIQRFRPSGASYPSSGKGAALSCISRQQEDEGEAELYVYVGLLSCPNAAMDEKQKATFNNRHLTSNSHLGSGCTTVNSTPCNQEIEKNPNGGAVSCKKRNRQWDCRDQPRCMRHRTSHDQFVEGG